MARGSARPNANVEQQDAWTFGQILQLLLLIAPIWSLVTTFAFRDRSERLRHPTRIHENSAMVASAVETSSRHERVTYITTPGIVGSRSTIENRVDHAGTSATKSYISSYWIGPCLAFVCLVILAVTCMQLLFVTVGFDSLVNFWINHWGTIYIFIFVHPLALQSSILIGLAYEKGLLGDRSTPSRSKPCRALLWLTIFTVWVFFIAIWLFSSNYLLSLLAPLLYERCTFCIRGGEFLSGSVVLHLLYVIGYSFQALRSR